MFIKRNERLRKIHGDAALQPARVSDKHLFYLMDQKVHTVGRRR